MLCWTSAMACCPSVMPHASLSYTWLCVMLAMGTRLLLRMPPPLSLLVLPLASAMLPLLLSCPGLLRTLSVPGVNGLDGDPAPPPCVSLSSRSSAEWTMLTRFLPPLPPLSFFPPDKLIIEAGEPDDLGNDSWPPPVADGTLFLAREAVLLDGLRIPPPRCP